MKAVLACHSSQAAAATYVYFWVCFWGVHVCVHGGDLPSAPAWAYKISVWISVIKIKQTVGNWQQQVSPKTSVDNIIQKTFIMMNVLIWAFPNTGGYVNLNESIIPSIIFIYLTCAHLQSFCLSLVMTALSTLSRCTQMCFVDITGIFWLHPHGCNARKPTGSVHIFWCVKIMVSVSTSQTNVRKCGGWVLIEVYSSFIFFMYILTFVFTGHIS